MQVQSLASLSGLRIPRCCGSGCGCSVGRQLQIHSTLAWELPYATGAALKRKTIKDLRGSFVYLESPFFCKSFGLGTCPTNSRSSAATYSDLCLSHFSHVPLATSLPIQWSRKPGKSKEIQEPRWFFFSQGSKFCVPVVLCMKTVVFYILSSFLVIYCRG